jgi:plastocyanin
MVRFAIVAAFSASVAQAQAVAVTLKEWSVGLSRDTVSAGSVTFRVTNAGTVNHALYVRGEGTDKGTKDIAPKQQASLVLTLKPGTYEVFCSMSDESHKNAGMKTTLVVKAGAPAAPSSEPKKPATF